MELRSTRLQSLGTLFPQSGCLLVDLDFHVALDKAFLHSVPQPPYSQWEEDKPGRVGAWHCPFPSIAQAKGGGWSQGSESQSHDALGPFGAWWSNPLTNNSGETEAQRAPDSDWDGG